MIDIAGLDIEACAASLPLIEVVDPVVAAGFVPGGLYPGLTFDGTDISIPLTTLAPYGLTAANADPSTGDSRALLYSLLWRAHDWQTDLAAAPQAAATTMKVSVSNYGSFPNALSRAITLTAYVDGVTGAVVSEPE